VGFVNAETGQCDCAVDDVAFETGCTSACQSVATVLDCDPRPDGGCETILLWVGDLSDSISACVKSPVSAKVHPMDPSRANAPETGAGMSVLASSLRARREPMRLSAVLLAQQTVVLRI
ncbi:MAG: hypothetical protein WD708_09725, partial [Kiritimatiellia bacterium]